MYITLNGRRQEIKGEESLSRLLTELKIEARTVAIEVNEHLIPKSEWSDCVIKEGDRIEILQAMGGGA